MQCPRPYMISQAISWTDFGSPGPWPNVALDHILSHTQFPRPTLVILDYDAILFWTIYDLTDNLPDHPCTSLRMSWAITDTVQLCSGPNIPGQLWMSRTVTDPENIYLYVQVLYHFDCKFTRCYALRVNLLSSLVHEPKQPLRKILKFMYREFEQLVSLFGCVIWLSRQCMHTFVSK